MVVESGSEMDSPAHPKRKSPFVGRRLAGLPGSGSDSDLPAAPKVLRHCSREHDLPPLRPNECELVVDIHALVDEVSALEHVPTRDYQRVERASTPQTFGRLIFELVIFLTRRVDSEGNQTFEIGLYVRAREPPSLPLGAVWTYRHVSFMAMLINCARPFSTDSRVHKDNCDLSSLDPCRGWPSVTTFTDISELKSGGFLTDTGNLVARAQVFFEGSEIVHLIDTAADKSALVPYTGLENQGATCYLNGLLQSLFHIGRMREIVYRGNDIPSEEPNVLTALQQMFFELEENACTSEPASSEPLTEAFGWDSVDVGVQHDAQELNRLMIDRLEARLKPTGRDEDVRSLFVGRVENYIDCVDVDFKSARTEEFYDIQLNLVTGYGDDKRRISSLTDALKEYLAVEVLEGANAYDAGEGFTEKQTARKGVRFQSLPPVLSFQLMRFHFDLDTCEMTKLHDRFEYPTQLDMSPFCPECPWKYKLFSVVVHSGGFGGGHYYAFIKPYGESSWVRFDDSVVERVDEWTAVDGNFGGIVKNGIENYLVNRNHASEDDNLRSSASDDSDSSSVPVRAGKGRGQRYKTHSAYMLMYVREDLSEEILRPRSIDSIHPGLREQLLEGIVKRRSRPAAGRTRRSSRRASPVSDQYSVHVRVLDGESGLMGAGPVFGIAEMEKHAEWFRTLGGEEKVDSEEKFVDLRERVKASAGEGCLFLVVPDEDSRTIRFMHMDPLSVNEATVGQVLEASGLHRSQPMIFYVESSGIPMDWPEGAVPAALLEYTGEGLKFRGVRYVVKSADTAEIGASVASALGMETPVHVWANTEGSVFDPVSVENLVPGAMLLVQSGDACVSENAAEFVGRVRNSFPVDILVHSWDSKWLLKHVPAVENALVPRRGPTTPRSEDMDNDALTTASSDDIERIHIDSLDWRLPVECLKEHIPNAEGGRLFLFRDNPFMSEISSGHNFFQTGACVRDALNAATFAVHAVLVPANPAAEEEGETERWLESTPVCVRYFSKAVVEVKAVIVFAHQSETIGAFIERARIALGLEQGKELRLVEVDTRDCEITGAHTKNDAGLMCTLQMWGAENIFANCVRIEEMEQVDDAAMEGSDDDVPACQLRCFHLDRGARSPFGHPFILPVPAGVDSAHREEFIRMAISEKLGVSITVVRGWRVLERDGTLMIGHPCNPVLNQGTPREKPLFIKG